MIGMINLLKPAGPTSHDVVNWLRRQLGIRRIGHLGTLDPGAAGVLPICLGTATRLAEYMADWSKTYRAEILLGLKTDSQDLFGRPLALVKPDPIPMEQIREVLQQMLGPQEQLPPMVSAVKHQGKRLYELARQGKTVARKPRRIIIESIDADLIQSAPWPRVHFETTVSKGTYIRTMCAEIGERLGCGACMGFLIRTGCGPFSIADSWTLEEIQTAIAKGNFSFRLSPKQGLKDWPVWTVKPGALRPVLNGNTLGAEHLLNPDTIMASPGTQGFLQGTDGELLAVGLAARDAAGQWCLKPKKVLVAGNVLR